MSVKNILYLNKLSGFTDLSLLALRLLTGAFLVWGVWDNILHQERMTEFIAFMTQFGFPYPALLAPLSVWMQFICGLLLCVGLFTRWAGLLMVFNFVVGFLMVHLGDDFRAQFPALILIGVNLHFVAVGGGRFALDRVFGGGETR
ncbi:MAG: hypothetical protein DHS20C05_20110 [Hyphococcus sp.]|nr:MAG: hypothetical protein DHS20C05_20110 [Marinicaulis sp.]